MSVADFKPVLMLGQMILQAAKTLIGAEFCNTDIGIGLKTKGTKITMNTMGSVTSADTSETVPMTYDDAETDGADLEITIDKTVAVRLSDNDLLQIEAGAMQMETAYGNRMIYTLNDDVDQLIMGKYSDITTENYESGTTSWQWGASPTAAELGKFFASVHASMDGVNAEQQGRFIVLPNLAIQGIRIALPQIATPVGDEVWRNGFVANNLMGFKVFQSANVVTASSVMHAMAGTMPNVGAAVPGVFALAVQIAPKVEKLRLEGFWAEGIRARVTAGAAVTKPERAIDINLNSSLLA